MKTLAAAPAAAEPAAAPAATGLRLKLSALKPNEVALLLEELGNLGTVSDVIKGENSLEATLDSSVAKDDLVAVLCFVIDESQISFPEAGAAQPVAAEPVAAEPAPVATTMAEAEIAATPANVTELAPWRNASRRKSPRRKPANRAAFALRLRRSIS